MRGGRRGRPSGRRWLGWVGLSLGGVLGSPDAAAAQTVAREQLVGTWSRVIVNNPDRRKPQEGPITEMIWTLNADGTWQRQIKINGVEQPKVQYKPGTPDWTAGSWTLTGDTLQFKGLTPKYKVVVGAQQFVMSDYRWVSKCKTGEVFHRIDPSKPRPAVPPVPPSAPATIKPAELLGSWVVTLPADANSDPGAVDTLTFKADSTWTGSGTEYQTVIQNGQSVVTPRTRSWTDSTSVNRWYILPGDTLWLPRIGKDDKIVGGYRAMAHLTMQGPQQFSLQPQCGSPWVAKRITP